MKQCTGCKQDLDISEFSPKGKGRLHPKCKKCRVKIESSYYHKSPVIREKKKRTARKCMVIYKARNRAFVWKYKSDAGCLKCGEKDHVALDAHHIDASVKEYTLNKLLKMSCALNKIKKELAKCVVLCANCHRKFHAGRFTINEKTPV